MDMELEMEMYINGRGNVKCCCLWRGFEMEMYMEKDGY